jgi:hypothetical protein
MTRIITIALALALSAAGAHAFGMGRFSSSFSKLGSLGQRGAPPAPAKTGNILRIDAVSQILRIDGTSNICRLGGC